MLTCNAAKDLGRNACIQKIGVEFYEKYRASATIAYGDFSDEGVIFCYVGVDDQLMDEQPSEPLILSNKGYNNPISFFSSCNVILASGEIVFLDFTLPVV